jgi:hypothetical protein
MSLVCRHAGPAAKSVLGVKALRRRACFADPRWRPARSRTAHIRSPLSLAGVADGISSAVRARAILQGAFAVMRSRADPVDHGAGAGLVGARPDRGTLEVCRAATPVRRTLRAEIGSINASLPAASELTGGSKQEPTELLSRPSVLKERQAPSGHRVALLLPSRNAHLAGGNAFHRLRNPDARIHFTGSHCPDTRLGGCAPALGRSDPARACAHGHAHTGSRRHAWSSMEASATPT